MAYLPPARMFYRTTHAPKHADWPQEPAYNAVSATTTLAQPFASAAPRPTLPKGEFLPEIREYVARCLQSEFQVPDIDEATVHAKLKDMITAHMQNNTGQEVDWATIPIVQHFIVEEREQKRRRLELLDAVPVPMTSNHMVTSRKRKSDNNLTDSSDETMPLPKGATSNAFGDRISYKDKGQADRVEKRTKKRREELRSQNPSKYRADLEKRKARFGPRNDNSHTVAPSRNHHSESPPATPGPVVGTCQNLEKGYLRLTSAPKAELVRPVNILQQTLEFLKDKWRSERKYFYVCDQFKSMRQDLAVQHVRTEFTVNVYEVHARIALEQGDMCEFNQCQSQLRELFMLGLPGNRGEFLAYRILYLIYINNRMDMNVVLTSLTEADKKLPEVRHALAVRSALALGNYHKAFRLYLECPNLGAYLMDRFLRREHLAAFATICKSYKPSIQVRFLTEELGFESDQACIQVFCDYNADRLIEQTNDVLTVKTGNAGNVFEACKVAAFRQFNFAVGQQI